MACAGREEGGGEKYKRMWCRGTPALKDLGGSCWRTLWQAPDSSPLPPPPSRGNILGGVAWLRLPALPTRKTHLAGTDWMALVSVALTLLWETHCLIHAFSLTGFGWMVTVWMDILDALWKLFLHSGSLIKKEITFFSNKCFHIELNIEGFFCFFTCWLKFWTQLTEFVFSFS